MDKKFRSFSIFAAYMIGCDKKAIILQVVKDAGWYDVLPDGEK